MIIKRIPLSKKEDVRGWLVQNESVSVRNHMKHFLVSTSKPGAIRGEHYHKRKIEWFLVIKGEALIVFKDVKNLEEKSIRVNGDTPEMIEIRPMVAHSIKNIGATTLYLIGLINESFDRANPDTFAYNVLNNK